MEITVKVDANPELISALVLLHESVEKLTAVKLQAANQPVAQQATQPLNQTPTIQTPTTVPNAGQTLPTTTPTAVNPAQPVGPSVQTVPSAAPTAAPTTMPTIPTAEAPTTVPSNTAPTAQAPTSAPTYDFNHLATATMQLQQAGQNILEIFSAFGIQALNQLPKERYGEYAAFLRQRGAKI